ncbi:hypothetical protein Acsp02_93130 [Actinoplanes sp. NBRC 103695]|nr:hypothetical protein Acsp02_93130 [Actinoplanes sp. NBRC 103695]
MLPGRHRRDSSRNAARGTARSNTQSRQARDHTPYFPDIVAHLSEWFSPGTVVDDELIIWDEDTAGTSAGF